MLEHEAAVFKFVMGFRAAGLERKGQNVVEKIIADVDDEADACPGIISREEGFEKDQFLVGAVPGNGAVLEAGFRGVVVQEGNECLAVVDAQAEGEAVAEDEPGAFGEAGVWIMAEALGIGGVNDVEIMMPVPGLEAGGQSPAELGMVTEKAWLKMIAFGDLASAPGEAHLHENPEDAQRERHGGGGEAASLGAGAHRFRGGRARGRDWAMPWYMLENSLNLDCLAIIS